MKPAIFRQQHRSSSTLDPAYWSFALGGLVAMPLPLSYRDLLDFPATTMECAIACIGNPPGGPSVTQAQWHGVSLDTLLNEVQVLPGARYAHLHAADGYATSIHWEQLRRAMLAYGMDDAALPAEFGGPVRLIVPGLYGYKMPRWIQRIILAAEPRAGFWEKRGWSAEGEVRVTSAIRSASHHEGKMILRGIAYAGEHPITGVEVSIDDGPWMPVAFHQKSTYAWADWSVNWTPPDSGEYLVKVRAVDRMGRTQDEANSRPFPNGASGIHSIVIKA